MPDIGLLGSGAPPRAAPVPASTPSPSAAPGEDPVPERALARAAAPQVAILRERADDARPEALPVPDGLHAQSRDDEDGSCRLAAPNMLLAAAVWAEPALVVEAVAEPVPGTATTTPAAAMPAAPLIAVIHAGEATAARDAPASPARVAPPPAPAFAPPPIQMRDLLWLALALLAIIGTGLGIRDPWPADEPRFAAVARDMVATGEWLFPRVGGDLYQDKPPLFFWLLAVCYMLTGSLKAAFLIPSFLAAGAVMFLVYDLGRRLVSRTAGVAAAILVVSTLHFVLTMRGAQIDPTLCFLTTFSLYALLRHLLLGPAWRWYFVGGLAAGLGIITKGVGFLPLLVLLPYFLMRAKGWQGLPAIEAGRAGWRWWLAPLAMLLGICLWFVPMMAAVEASGAPEYAAYRDEILFKQTAGRYAAAWHHVKAWYYFIVEVIPPLWVPWSVLLFWLVPRFRGAWRARDARVWLPLAWVLLVLLFFSASPGKRGVYILPALPALALATLPFLDELLAKRGVRIASIVAAALLWAAGAALLVAKLLGFDALSQGMVQLLVLLPFVLIAGALIALALWRKPVAAYPAAVAALAIWFSYFLAPLMNGERSGRAFIHQTLRQVKPGEELGLVAYKEQFLLYLDRPTVNFGHRRWLEGPQESFDAAAWLAAAPDRVLLVPAKTRQPCFPGEAKSLGTSSGDEWYLVRSASAECVQKGDRSRAIRYPAR